ncbi:MAG: hypothetical protein BKP49_04545 [Treponema sp. CETP13]|nr:MAG: hypothetical protein BKP49_04545 [Treponema sp. CETP13]
MNGSKKNSNKFLNWIASNKNTTFLVVLFLILLNLVCTNAYFRIDLTKTKSYSLSESSKTLVSTLEQPLAVKVFFTDNLPSPYNTTEQYLKDILLEYKNNSNDKFSYTFFDMSDSENKSMAAEYNLRQVQVQQVTDTEVGVKQAYMGLVLVYADRIETVDGLTESSGMEYKLTSAMSKMISSTSSLAGLSGSVKMTLYITPELSDFNIANFDKVDSAVVDAIASVNAQNNNRITFNRVVPSEDEISELVDKYGLPGVNWNNKDGTTGTGTIGLVLEYKDAFRIVPVTLVRSLFGYAVSGLDDLSTSISDSLDSLVSKQVDVAYLTGNGELSLADKQNGAANLRSISKDWYNFIGVDLETDSIPTGVKTLIINGPSQELSDVELYKIDQFVMKGGNLLVMADPFIEVQNQQYAAYGMPPTYEPNPSNISKLLSTYGVDISSSYIMDEECYTQTDNQYGKLNYYFVPLVKQQTINQDSVITANIPYIVLFNTASVTPNFTDEDANGRMAQVLLSSSDNAWNLSKNIVLSPMAIQPPAKTSLKKESLSVLLNGKFTSAFDSIPEGYTEGEVSESKENSVHSSSTVLNANTRLSSGVQKSTIIVCGSSKITTSSVIDENGTSATATFLRNAIDYLNGNADLCSMRTKGIASSTFTIENPVGASLSKLFNQYGLPLLIVIFGFIMWRLRIARRKKIQLRYYPEGMSERLGEKPLKIKIEKTQKATKKSKKDKNDSTEEDTNE